MGFVVLVVASSSQYQCADPHCLSSFIGKLQLQGRIDIYSLNTELVFGVVIKICIYKVKING